MKGKNLIFIIIGFGIAIIAFFIGISIWDTESSGSYGSLLAGTFGVVGNVGAMIAMILTLQEQQKINKQKDIIDGFKYEFDRYASLVEDKTIVKELYDLWKCDEENKDSKDTVYSSLNEINYNLKNETFSAIERLKYFSENENLKKLSTCLNRLSAIMEKVGDLNTEVGRQIVLDWEEIPKIWKRMVGFYLAWNTSDVIIETAKNNKLIGSFAKEEDFLFRLSGYIPVFQIEEQESRAAREKWKDHYIFIKSKSIFEISQMNLYFKDERPEPFTIKLKISISPSEKKKITLYELFGKSFDVLISRIEQKLGKKAPVIVYVDLYINYKGNEKYMYKGSLEFNIYPDENENRRTGMASK